MALTLNREARERLFNEDIAWLMTQPRSLERDHIEDVLRWMRDQDDHEQLRRLHDAVWSRLRAVQQLIARGKGTWPNSDYIRDATWDGWYGELRALESALVAAGFNPSDQTEKSE